MEQLYQISATAGTSRVRDKIKNLIRRFSKNQMALWVYLIRTRDKCIAHAWVRARACAIRGVGLG